MPTVKRRQASHQPKEGAKPLNVPADIPQADWMRNRTLHHFPHEVLGHRLGLAAFVMLILLLALVAAKFVMLSHGVPTWIRVMAFLAGALANGFGIFSQVLTGGLCWIGAVSMGLVWVVLIMAMVVGLM